MVSASLTGFIAGESGTRAVILTPNVAFGSNSARDGSPSIDFMIIAASSSTERRPAARASASADMWRPPRSARRISSHSVGASGFGAAGSARSLVILTSE